MAAPKSTLSELVKEMVKEMDADEFYARGDMYDESAEEQWFKVEITFAQGEGAPASFRASLRKPWCEFQRLHCLLFTDEFGCDDAIKDQLPKLPSGQDVQGDEPECGSHSGRLGGVNANSTEVARELGVYLNALLSIPAVVQSQVFSGFLDEQSRHGTSSDDGDVDRSNASGGTAGSNGSHYQEAPRDPFTAIDFLVQPFDYTSAYVPRRATHVEHIDVLRGESVVWKFEVLDHLDIDFSVVFRPHPVVFPPHTYYPEDAPPAEEEEAVSWNEFAVLEGGEAVLDAGSKSTMTRAWSDEFGQGTGRKRQGRGSSAWWGGGAISSAREKQEEDEVVMGTDAAATREANEELKGETVHLPTRYSTGGADPVQGSFTCPADGTCVLRWDNSYSRLRGKRLRFVMESVTVQTMRAAIEAAGAADHKRHTKRSAAVQGILDSDSGQVEFTVTAISPADGASNAGDSSPDGADDSSDGKTARTSRYGNFYGSGGGAVSSYHRFGRVRRVAAALLRDLGTLVDAQEGVGAVDMGAHALYLEERATRVDRSNGEGGDAHPTPPEGAGGRGGRSQHIGGSGGGDGHDRGHGGRRNVDMAGICKLVEKFELLEDELASSSARRAQSDAQAKVLLATLQKTNTKVDRLERDLQETQEQLAAVRLKLEETEGARDGATAAKAVLSSRLQMSEEELLRARRERDLLQAERSVWQVARSGIQEELAKVVADLEQERHRHEDKSHALTKSHESRAHAEAEVARLSRRLEEERGGIGGIRAALASEREASRLAREEAEDARTAVAELDATVAELTAQKRVLVAGLRARERALGDRCASAEARAEESGMMRRAAEARVRELEEEAERREAAQADGEIRLQRLRAEKKVLLAEIRRGPMGGGGLVGTGVSSAGEDGTSSVAGDVPGSTYIAKRGAGGVEVTGSDEDAEEGGTTGAAADMGAVGAPDGSNIGRVVSVPSASMGMVQDNKAMLKQLSRQLVHLRERQHHLREDLDADPDNPTTRRLQSDVDRAVKNLEIRIRRLLTVVAGGISVESGDSVESPPPVEGRKAVESGRDSSEGARTSSDVPRLSTQARPSSPLSDDVVESFAV